MVPLQVLFRYPKDPGYSFIKSTTKATFSWKIKIVSFRGTVLLPFFLGVYSIITRKFQRTESTNHNDALVLISLVHPSLLPSLHPFPTAGAGAEPCRSDILCCRRSAGSLARVTCPQRPYTLLSRTNKIPIPLFIHIE